ncbi:HMCN1-like protein, partial [Mya arenaria]
HGIWSQWSDWNACPVTCANSTITRTRTCTDPAPVGDGMLCDGDDTETDTCVLDPCPMSRVKAVHACAHVSAVTRNRSGEERIALGHRPRRGHATKTIATFLTRELCLFGQLSFTLVIPPQDGNWGTWQEWQGCSVTCDTGVQRRYRQCDDPAPDFGGEPCTGLQSLRLFHYLSVAIDGAWGEWSENGCSATCGSGRSTKVRVCDNPAPSNGGNVCTGDTMIVESCIIRECTAEESSDSFGYGAGYLNKLIYDLPSKTSQSHIDPTFQSCPDGFFTCYSGRVTCIDEEFRCDCEEDCYDGSDENELWAGC